MLREFFHRFQIWWRRRRLLSAYADVFKAKTGKSVGFTPLMSAYEQAERDDVLEVGDGDVIWHWPAETAESE